LERLLDAAEELLAERGIEGLSVSALSERSGLSNGAIYWRFDTIDAIVQSVHQRIVERLQQEHAFYDDPGGWRDLSAPDLVAAAVREEAELFRRHAAPLRVLALASASNEALAARGAEAVHWAETRFAQHLAPALGAAGASEPMLLAVVIFRIVYGALAVRVIWPEHQREPQVPWEAFVGAVAEMARHHVTAALDGAPT
jgi:AcrR family transcriptional regulator